MKIAYSFPRKILYRAGVWCCPECNYEPDSKGRITDAWDEPKQVKDIVLRGDAVRQNPATIMVSSECKKCLAVSFHHWRFDYFYSVARYHDYPKEIVVAVKKEHKRRLRNEKRRWAASPCSHGCRFMKKVDWYYCYPSVTCSIGKGGMQTKKEGCDRFKRQKQAEKGGE